MAAASVPADDAGRQVLPRPFSWESVATVRHRITFHQGKWSMAWTPKCDCGWSGADFAYREHAESSADDHYRRTTTDDYRRGWEDAMRQEHPPAAARGDQ